MCNENHEKREKTEKVHCPVPKSRGVPKVVCLRGCVPKEQQCEKIHNFHHFCAPAKVLPWCERFSLLFAIFRDADMSAMTSEDAVKMSARRRLQLS